MAGNVAAIIRPAHRADLPAIYGVVLQTADSGGDATALHRLPDVQGDVYAGPYVTFEPALAFVLEDDRGLAGFVVGALDSASVRGAAGTGVVAAAAPTIHGHGQDASAA